MYSTVQVIFTIHWLQWGLAAGVGEWLRQTAVRSVASPRVPWRGEGERGSRSVDRGKVNFPTCGVSSQPVPFSTDELTIHNQTWNPQYFTGVKQNFIGTVGLRKIVLYYQEHLKRIEDRALCTKLAVITFIFITLSLIGRRSILLFVSPSLLIQ